jgi:hypothetical protein
MPAAATDPFARIRAREQIEALGTTPEKYGFKRPAPTALQQAGAVLAAAGEAEHLAWEAMLDGRVRYSGRLGWAQRNLLECWLFYTRCTRIGGVSLDGARNHLRRAIKQYRHLNVAETRGIDTSVPGWRGGRVA